MHNSTRAEQNIMKFGTHWVLVKHIWSIFDLVVFDVISRSFGALLSKWLVTRQRVTIERNRLKCLIQGFIVVNIWGTFVYCSRLSGDYSV